MWNSHKNKISYENLRSYIQQVYTKYRTAFLLNFGISIVSMIVEITHKIRTAFKAIASTTWRLKNKLIN